MKFTQVAPDSFEKFQLNAGIMLNAFDPAAGTFSPDNIIGATSGGVNVSAVPTFVDFGDDVDNIPANTKELKKIDSWEIKMSGSFKTIDEELAKMLTAASDAAGGKVTLRSDLLPSDFVDVWWVGDYSDKNGATNGGCVAIKLENVISTGGFSVQSADKNKGTFAFELTAHYSLTDIDKVPCEIYIKPGTEE